jgi:Leucine-rich repeat (LRR) protein
VNLQWLDLSFNLITTIEGLDKCWQLTDLSLFKNKIKKLGGLGEL